MDRMYLRIGLTSEALKVAPCTPTIWKTIASSCYLSWKRPIKVRRRVKAVSREAARQAPQVIQGQSILCNDEATPRSRERGIPSLLIRAGAGHVNFATVFRFELRG